MTAPEFKDLSGDSVYDYLKASISNNFELVGAYIVEHKVTSYNQARKEIYVKVKSKTSDQAGTLVYNYKKLERNM